MKRSLEVDTEDAKRLRLGGDADPRVIVSWNCQGLISVLKGNRDGVSQFVEATDPDVIALQEVTFPYYTAFALSS